MQTIKLLVTSDVHGNVFPTNYRDDRKEPLGLARVSSLINQIRSKNAHVMLLDNGDMIQGTPLTYHHAKFHPESANPMIASMNALRYDAAVLGNHEFNYGLSYLQAAVGQAKFPYLCANILDETAFQPLFGKPYMVKEFAGIKIAVIGVTTQFIPNWEDPRHIEGLHFAHVLESTRKWVKEVKETEQPDVLIVAYHGGFERDLETGEPTESLTGENVGYEICHSIEGIDILVTGHQHRALADKVNGVTVIQPGNNGLYLGEVSLQMDQQDEKWTLKEASAKLHEISLEIKPDQTIVELVQPYEDATQKWLDQPIGKIEGDMTIKDAAAVRLEESAFVEFINKVQMDVTGAAVSSTALFHNQSPGFPSDITMRDIVSNYIYPNTLKVIRITGHDIKQALELSASYFSLNRDSEIVVSKSFLEPKPQHYNYDMWEGIEYEIDVSKPLGSRIVKLEQNGLPVQAGTEYDVVMNNYRAAGGGEYFMFKGKPVIREITTDMSELIANYINEKKVIQATVNHNWKVFASKS